MWPTAVECKDEDPDDAVDVCDPTELWRDNPREALKGLPIVTEKLDESGRYLSTEVTSYRLKHLYTGRDGVEVFEHSGYSRSAPPC